MFFPSPAERALPAFVRAEFPFPLALTCARLEAQMDRDEPIAAAWALRDAFECAVKFSACVAVADFLQVGPPRDEAAALAALLLKPSGIVIGDWHTLLAMALVPLAPLARDGRLDTSGRRLPELFGAFFQAGVRKTPSPTALNASIGGDKGFVNWRNRVFGHGVFKEDRRYYADETLNRLPDLVRFYEALRPVLTGWRLVGLTPGGERVDWTGCEAPLAATTGQRHEHKPWGEPLPMRLVPQDHPGRAELDFGPLLTVQRCEVCGEPAAFFFDRHRYDRERDKHRTHFLEYLRGHPGERKDWSEARRLAGLLPAGFEWQRTSWDVEEVVEGVRLTFADFETEYLRPAYLLDALWQTVAERPGGYVHVSGPAGVGKTYLVRGMEKESAGRGVPVLAYHILPGARADYQTFVGELHAAACECKRLQRARTLPPQVAVGSVAELQEQFAGYLTTLMEKNGVRTLVLVIDAVDELAERDGTSPVNAATILDLLPPAGKLPEGCFVVLTSRPEMRPGIRERLDRLRAAAGEDRFVALDVRPDAPANEALLRAYLAAHLPEPFRAAHHAEEVLRRSGGVFLYAYHLARALAAGAFTDTAALPEGREFYPAYLARLRERVGAELYENVYLPSLLLLAAARAPVTLEQLTGWGVPGDRLRFALIDLRDFLREHRVRRWHESLNREGDNRYEMAHEAFVRFVAESDEYGPRYRQAHGAIADAALAVHDGRWEEIDPWDEAGLYALRFVPAHCRLAGRPDEEDRLLRDERYARECWGVAYIAQEQARYHLAVELWGTTEVILRRAFEQEGRADLAPDLASIIFKRADAMLELGHPGEAVWGYDKAIDILRPLSERQPDQAVNLAATLANRSAALRDLGRLEEAVCACDAAIDLFRQLVERDGRLECTSDLATAIMNKGDALFKLDRLSEAKAAWDESLDIRRRLVEREGGDWRHPQCRHERTLDIRRRLVEREGGEGQAVELANLLTRRGIALCWGPSWMAAGRGAVEAHDEAIDILRRLIGHEGRSDLLNHLADALLHKGAALERTRRPQTQALAAYEEAIDIRRRLVDVEGRRELADDLANALVQRANFLHSDGRLAEAVTAYDEAINILRQLVESEERAEMANKLAGALRARGVAREKMGDLQEALLCYSECIRHRETLVEAGLRHLTSDLILDYRWRFDLLRQLDRWPDAAADVAHAVRVSLPLFEDGNPPASVVSELTHLFRPIISLSFEERQQLDAALAPSGSPGRQLLERFLALEREETLRSCSEAMRRWEEDVRAGQRHMTYKLVEQYRIRFDTLRGMTRWSDASADVSRAIHLCLPFLEGGNPRPTLVQELTDLLRAVDRLGSVERQQLDAALGEDAGLVRQLSERFVPQRVTGGKANWKGNRATYRFPPRRPGAGGKR